jgi:DNA polymerase
MPLCLAYAFDEDSPGLWNLASKPPTELLDRIAGGEEFAAFNAAFDMRIWNNICARDFHWPEIKLSQVVDVQTLAQTYTLPGSLDKSGEALGIHMLKSKTGTALIKKCCCPDKNGKQPMPNTPEMRQAFRDLEKYCLQDVRAMQEIVYSLPRPRLIPQEQLIWELTYNMNDEGLPIDDTAVRAIIKYLDAYITHKVKDLPKATGGAVSTPGQIAKIKAFCESKGVKLSDLTALTVERTLARRELPPAVRTVLELRQELGRSSTAKYKKVAEQMIALNGDGVYRVYDNVACHATNTGRWGGRGFQMHNLPRAKKKKPERWINYFLDNVRMANPVGAAKALIRPMIKAPDGQVIIVSDYSSIENRILAWSAGDTQTLQDFADGIDQYKTMASARFGVPYSEVTKEQRRVGKAIILGCGYGMGGKKFKQTAKDQADLDLTDDEAKASVDAYRSHYHLIKTMWTDLKKAAVRAVVTRSQVTSGKFTFGTFVKANRRWLAMKLPTGKCLYYLNPTVNDMLIPGFEEMGPTPTITHEGYSSYTRKWTRLKLIPGRITENAIQGTAREVMAQGLLNIQRDMPQIRLLGSVHDEALGLIRLDDLTDSTLEEFSAHLCNVDFLPGCPLAAEGYISKRYKKD